MLSDNQCSSCKHTYGGMVGLQRFTLTLGGMVIVLVREWFTLKCFMGDGVVFRKDGIPLNASTADNHRHEN